MSLSISQLIEITCSKCNTIFQSEVWFVVDILEQPDLVDLIVHGDINLFKCPKCNFQKNIESPLILYRPDSLPKLILSVRGTQLSGDEQELIEAIIDQLKNKMRDGWNDDWLGEMPVVEMNLLPMLLTKGFGAVQLEYMKRNFVGPMDGAPKLIFEILENLPTEEKESFVAGLSKVNNSDEFLEYLNKFPKINQVIDSEIERSILEITHKLGPLADKAAELFRSYQGTKDTNALSQAISAWADVVTHPLFGNLSSDEKAYMLNDAGVALRSRFDEFNEVEDLYQSIKLFENGVDLSTEESTVFSALFSNLGPALFERFKIGGKKDDLDRAITTLNKAVELAGSIKLENISLLINLGVCLSDRFDYFGQKDDLIASIQNYKMAEKVLPMDHVYYPAILCNLGSSLMRQVETEKEPHVLNEAISYLQRADELTPQGSSFLGEVLLNLGLGYSIRFELLELVKE